jgi:ribonuclease HI
MPKKAIDTALENRHWSLWYRGYKKIWRITWGSHRQRHANDSLATGPGGSGACVVRVAGPSGAATVVWSASMSLAHRSTTNNQAEYHGLLAGLRAAEAHAWTNLEVIEDSALILRQLRDNRPPKNAKLLRLYAQARRLADQLDVRHWTHHVRDHNKMADSLANLAMDARTSTQVIHPTARSGHDTVHDHLSNDLSPWLADTVDRRGALSVLP